MEKWPEYRVLGRIVTCTRSWIANWQTNWNAIYRASISAKSLHRESCWRWRRSSHIPKNPDTEAWTKSNTQKHVAFAAAAQSSESDLGPGTPLQAEKEATQSSEIDLRAGGISHENIYSDKQYMDEVKKQLEKLQDESKSKSTHKDLQKGNLLSEETSLKISEMANIELHEVRQRTATSQCPQCLSHMEDGFQFCKVCKWMIQPFQEFKRDFKNYLATRTVFLLNRAEARKHGNKPWQIYHSKAKDAMRHIVKDGLFTSILERFQKDQRYRGSQIVHDWDDVDTSTTWWPLTLLTKHHMNNVNVTTICGDLNVDRRTTSWVQRKRGAIVKQHRRP